jgi:orotate phosphoribosyltransferase
VSEDLLARLTRIGALKEGHFLLSSGRHSDRYFEKFDLLRLPAETEAVCRGFSTRFAGSAIDVVVGPTTGGILLAFEVARQLKVASAYAERRSDGAQGAPAGREIRRGTTFSLGQRILVIDDILTTGGSIRETLTALATHPVEVIAVAVLLDRSGGTTTFGDVPLFSLSTLNVETWEPADCPLCAQGSPVTKPGTTPTL